MRGTLYISCRHSYARRLLLRTGSNPGALGTNRVDKRFVILAISNNSIEKNETVTLRKVSPINLVILITVVTHDFVPIPVNLHKT